MESEFPFLAKLRVPKLLGMQTLFIQHIRQSNSNYLLVVLI